MSTIEPTEEQREAALRFCKDHSVCGNGWLVDEFTVAELLAEREAKLRERCVCIGVETGRAERDALRARVAELERLDLDRDRALYLAEVEYFAASAREAQHLADIKALREALGQGYALSLNAREQVLKVTAHYDDAKAEEPAVDWQAWANGSCPEPGCSLANPHEQGVACVKPTAEGRCAMSEPVIRPWSYKCFAGCEDVEANHLDGIDPRSVHHHSVDPLYTRDDLVRVARESRESVWVKFSGDEDATVVFEETSADLVDRLTKGET